MKGIITVVGKDQVGIIHGVSKVLVDYNVNVEAFINRGGRIPAPIHSFKN